MDKHGLRAENNRFYSIEDTSAIGRDVECQICLTDKRVSRRHASLTVKEGFLYIKDERSSNGTYVNGIRISRQTLLQAGDRVRVGDILFRVEYPQTPEIIEEKTTLEQVTPYEDTGVTVAPLNRHSPPSVHNDASPIPYEEEEGQADAVEPLRRRSASWRNLFRLRPWHFWTGVVLGIFLFVLLISSLWNFVQPVSPSLKPPTLSAPALSFVTMEIGEEGGQLENEQGVIVNIPIGAFDQPESIILSQVASSGTEAPALPVGLEALGNIYRVEWQPQISPQQSLQIDLPIDIVPRNSLLAAYRILGEGWQSLGGLIFDGKLRFDLDSPAVLRLAVLRSSGSYGEYRPVLIMNSGDAALVVRPWQWWLPPNIMSPGTAALSTMAINIEAHQAQELEASLAARLYGYASLPYGTYSNWCVSWRNTDLNQTVYAILDQSVSLTPYSCIWEDYRTGQCEPEKAVFNVMASDEGNLLSCVEAGKTR